MGATSNINTQQSTTGTSSATNEIIDDNETSASNVTPTITASVNGRNQQQQKENASSTASETSETAETG